MAIPAGTKGEKPPIAKAIPAGTKGEKVPKPLTKGGPKEK